MNPTGLHIWTLDFHSAGVCERERFAVTAAQSEQALRSSKANEALVLCTCNRILWMTTGNAILPEHPKARVLEGDAAIRHLCRVATGLESLAIGKSHVLGQLKDAWRQACAAGTSGREFEYLLPRVIGLARRVRKDCSLDPWEQAVRTGRAAAALDAHVAELLSKYHRRASHQALAAAESRWDGLRRSELARIKPVFPAMDQREWLAIEELAWRLTRKLTHDACYAAMTRSSRSETASLAAQSFM